MLKATYKKVGLKFIQPAGTSRGYLTEKTSWIISLIDTQNPEIAGTGECSLIKGLSPDPEEEYSQVLAEVCKNPLDYLSESERLKAFPSIRFGLEMAWHDLQSGGKGILFNSSFTEGRAGIPINGLIWMGSKNDMLKQIRARIEEGFTCIKMKIGALDFREELDLLKITRKEFPSSDIQIRVDANGAFSPDNALEKLKQLSDFGLHSIEQPIKTRQWEQMAVLCEKSPLPVALDEELFASGADANKFLLLETIKPKYLVLKPSMLGGFAKTIEWIRIAESMKIGWWVTSALESNIGLNALAQWTFTLNNPVHHGLGTGKLFENNFLSQLFIERGYLKFQPHTSQIRKSSFEDITGYKSAPGLAEFLQQWNFGKESFLFRTSGSTGEPKEITVSSRSMIRSAELSGQALKLKRGETALLCMPLDFVAGKMMVVRSLVLGLKLLSVKPSSNPLKEIGSEIIIDFAAMTPMQVLESLNDPQSFSKLKQIHKLIIGGAPVSADLESKLQNLPGEVYETYGMTETLTHIALRRLNGTEQSEYFKTLPGISIGTDERGCLVIHAPHLDQPDVVTNDLVEIIASNHFRWLGRADHVINSGGIKIFPELVERKLEGKLSHRFIISSLPDQKLGRKVVLVVEVKSGIDPGLHLENLYSLLQPYERPRAVVFLEKFPETFSSKISRIEIQKLIEG